MKQANQRIWEEVWKSMEPMDMPVATTQELRPLRPN